MNRDRVFEQRPVGGVARMRITVKGTVQGVGFRPFVYLLAREHQLKGWVRNSPRGVDIDVEGDPLALDGFVTRLRTQSPPLARIDGVEHEALSPNGHADFAIVASDTVGSAVIPISPDVATCDACRREIFDAGDRRYRYPFTSCTHCGPRYSIIETIPYDRPQTSMATFPLCERCRAEYEDPLNRRFHAQANACPDCGPQIDLTDRVGRSLARRDGALRQAAQAIGRGEIVAVKGLGGFHLMTNAMSDEAVARLRQSKHRDEKPFALMMPSVASVNEHCDACNADLDLLFSPQAPIVLVRRRAGSVISGAVAPGNNPYLGVMLPYTPLHHVLMHEIGLPVVATSANLSEEPLCAGNDEALSRLGDIADLFLVHDRPIVNLLDDSVVRIVGGRPMVLRRARGYAPAPVFLDNTCSGDVLATGAFLCNTAAISIGNQCFISQHIGDLGSLQSYEHYKRVIAGLQHVYDHKPARVACDIHPDYTSTRYAADLGVPVTRVQHHYAHALSCMIDNGVAAPATAVCWDGTGDGGDGTVWGGEFLHVHEDGFERAAHLHTFALPGGEAAVREPCRAAIGALHETFGTDALAMTDLAPLRAFDLRERTLLGQVLERNLNTPRTSSAGRLFDAVASLLGVTQGATFEGQPAMMLEYETESHPSNRLYPFEIVGSARPFVVDWRPALRALVADVRAAVARGDIATAFHNTLAEAILQTCVLLDEKRVVLSGGCFQNKYLSERVIDAMQRDGFDVYWHRDVPPNDGGIALGQMAAAMQQRKGS